MILDLIGQEIKNKNILDVGCGDGVISYLLAKKGAKVIGIDNSEIAINFAKEKCIDLNNVEFLVASAHRLPFESKTFDYIVSSEVIEHLNNPDKMLYEIKRIWNKKGKIIITTPIKFSKNPLDMMHYQEFFQEDFIVALEKYFEDIKIIKSHPLFWMEFQNKLIFGHSFTKIFFNCLNIFFGFNPFKNIKGWKYYTLQTAVISK